jgi:hypothetical protein
MGNLGLPIIILLAAGILFLLCHPFFKRSNKDEGVDVNGQANDSELTGPVTITRQVKYPGTRPEESGLAIARYDTTYGEGKLRVSKWILARHTSYLTQSGHNVLYEYFREDGTLEHDRLVMPQAMLGGGVYVKTRLRYFDGKNQQVSERYLREDGTTGVVIDMKTGLFQQIRKDGKTLRLEQITVGDKYRRIWYKLDGKTIWIDMGVDGVAHVAFDLAGNPVDLNFTAERAIGSYGMGPQSQPLLTHYHKYTRQDGTLAYKQTWYARWDKAASTSVATLGAVTVYDAAGNSPVAEYTLDLRAASEPRFIKQVALHNADGTTLVRKYRSPGCRLSEDTLDGQQKVIGHQDFATSDRFQEVAADIIFQGFTENVWGFYDDESHDI